MLSNHRDEDIWGTRPATMDVNDYIQYKAWWADSGRPVAPHEWASAQAVHKGDSVFGQVLEIERFDGRHAFVYNSAVPIRDEEGHIIGSVVAIQDITELRNAQVALQQLNETLEKKVAERTALAEGRARQLQTLAVELLEAEERERRRVAELLHDDLQQILAAARMQVELICQEQSVGFDLSNVKKLLDESIAKSRRLSHELSPPVLQHSNLADALEWIVRYFGEQFGLQVALQSDLQPEASRRPESTPVKMFMFRAVQELLFNIVKHAGVKTARITLCSSNGFLVATVSDEGRGFNPDTIDAFSASFGLGLLSLRERARYIGGKLEIDSTPGQGSRFVLTVPLDMSADPASKPPAAAIPSFLTSDEQAHQAISDSIRVLFVDDHQVMRQGLIKLLSAQPGIQVAGEAANGIEAIDQVHKLRPDVVLMDVSMPKMDGIEATRRIKAQWPDIRVVALSMFEDEHIIRNMHEAGAETFVSKSASPAELLKAIFGMNREN